jgi:Zn-dependent protease
MQTLSVMQQLVVMVLPLVFAVTVHEAAHGWVADKLGDDTARSLGRITLNPIPHIDLVGTLLLPFSLYALSMIFGGAGFLFGYAKPLPVNVNRLHRPKRDMALVALAGPGANLLMALIWAGLFALGQALVHSVPMAAQFLLYTAAFGVLINAVLLVINLLPLLPLDGGRVVASILPLNLSRGYAKLEPWGLMILLVLLFSGILMPLIWPIIHGMQRALLGL